METREITLAEMLEAREQRWHRQQALLAQYGETLLSFTMNIPGPVKNSNLILRGFRRGQARIEAQMQRCALPVHHREEQIAPTGCEAFYVISADSRRVKALCAEIEDGDDIGRLFDMDVLESDGRQVSRGELGLGGRTCLICGGPAKVCSSTRAHSVPQLQAAVSSLLEAAFRREDSELAAALAVRSLLYEVCTTPKPGLVDCANSGSHSDMDLFTFLSSAPVLYPYFKRCVETGMDTARLCAPETLQCLRWAGKEAEDAMFAATAGVNTHKGAIFSMGLVCAALGRLGRSHWRDTEAVLDACAEMTRGLSRRELGQDRSTAGQRIFQACGAAGVRGQAEAGFPGAGKAGLPVLESALTQCGDIHRSGCAALLAIIAATEDTNLIARSDRETQRSAAAQAADILGREPIPSRETLEALDQAYIRRNLSPGGSADLLALSWFLHFLKEA